MTYAGAVQQLKSYIDMKLCAISKALSIKVDAIGAGAVTPTSTTTFTNKTIDGAGNTLTNIPQSAVAGGGFVDKSTNQTAIAGTKQVTSQWTFASAWAATQAIFGITGEGGRITFLNGTGGTSLMTVGATAATGDGASIISSGASGLSISNTGTGGSVALSATNATSFMTFSRGGTTVGRIDASGNWMFQNGGTYTNSGEFFQVIGTSKLSGNAFLTSGSSLYSYNAAFSGTTNYERLTINWNSNIATITTENGGTGVARALNINGGASSTIQVAGVTKFTASPTVITIGSGISLQSTSLTGQVTLGASTGSGGAITASIATLSGANVNQKLLSLIPSISQTGTASYSIFYASPFDNAANTGNKYLINVGTNSAATDSGTHTPKFTVTSTGRLFIGDVPTYADQSAATTAGLTTGTVFKTAAGVLNIVL